MKTDTIFQSERGLQFTFEEVRTLLAKLGITQSLSRSGNCYDNAPMELFFHTLKNELVLLGKLTTKYTTRIVIFKYFEVYYNRKRLLSSLRYRTPDEVYFDNSILFLSHLFGMHIKRYKETEKLQKEGGTLRANIEATVSEFKNGMIRGKKMRYRGMIKANMFMAIRGIVINFGREDRYIKGITRKKAS